MSRRRSTKWVVLAACTHLLPKLEDGWLPLFPLGRVSKTPAAGFFLDMRIVCVKTVFARSTITYYPTRELANTALKVKRRELNAFKCWYKIEADAVVVVHRLHLAPALWVRFNNNEIGRLWATSRLWRPFQIAGRYLARSHDKATGKYLYAHQAVAKAHDFDWAKVCHVSPDHTLDNRIENLAARRTRAISVANKSGVTGVHKTARGYAASWVEADGTQRSKYFSNAHHNARECAIDARKEAEQRLARKRAADAAELAPRAELETEDDGDEPTAAPEQDLDGDSDCEDETAQPAQYPTF